MDWNRVEGNWKQVKGKIKEQWGKLTDDDLDQIAGKRDQLRTSANPFFDNIRQNSEVRPASLHLRESVEAG